MKAAVSERPLAKPETEPQKAPRRKMSAFWIFIAVYTAVLVILNVLALMWKSFANYYVDHIFWLAADTTGLISGLFPFSLGEVLITLGIVLAVLVIVLSLLLIPLHGKERFKGFTVTYLKTMLVIALTVGYLYTFNCTILYCADMMSFDGGAREFDLEQLEEVRNYIVMRCNALAADMERSDDGTMIFSGNADEAAEHALHGISGEFPRLAGYYPHAKPMWGSYYMYKSGTIGVYFPFSMEANYSRYVSDSYLPHVVAHEYAHLKGYIYEDEANFISFIACVNSDDPAVEYSGYLCVLSYIDKDYKSAVSEERYNKQARCDDLVRFDNSCYDRATWEYLKKRDEERPQPKAAEIAEDVSDKMMDSYMDALDYTPNYSEVTLLMMQYYTEFGGFEIN